MGHDNGSGGRGYLENRRNPARETRIKWDTSIHTAFGLGFKHNLKEIGIVEWISGSLLKGVTCRSPGTCVISVTSATETHC